MFGIRPSWLLAPAVAAGGAYLYVGNEAPKPTTEATTGLQSTAILPPKDAASPSSSGSILPSSFTSQFPTLIPSLNGEQLVRISPSSRESKSIRIGSCNLDRLSRDKLKKLPQILSLVEFLTEMDLIAVQEITAHHPDALTSLVDQLNEAGGRFDYLLGPPVGRDEHKQQLAFIFNTDRIETDRRQLYTVNDPTDALVTEPLVGWFRVKGVRPELAFTFSLVNIHLSDPSIHDERLLLGDIIRGVQADGRREDDIILIGSLESSSSELETLERLGMTVALHDTPTDVAGMRERDNIVFHLQATDEYAGRSGVEDFLRKRNLSLEEAQLISDHLPIWAEFLPVEGGRD